MVNKINSKRLAIIFFIIITSLFTIILLISDSNKPEYYSLLFLLPLSFSILTSVLLFVLNKIKYKVSFFLIITMYGIRMLITPFFMYLGSYKTFGVEMYLSRYMNQALLLMTWEYFILITFCIYMNINTKLRSRAKNDVADNLNIKLPKSVTVLLFLLFIYAIFVFIGAPGLLKETFFFTTGRTEESYEFLFSNQVSYNIYGLSFGKYLVTILSTVIWMLQVLLPPYIITKIMKKNISKTRKKLMVYITIFLTLLITTESRSHSVEVALSLLLSIHYYYGPKKINFKFLIIIMVTVATVGLISKVGLTYSNDAWRELSVMFSAYFSGPQNVATSIAAKDLSNVTTIYNLPMDIIERIPYVTYLFKGHVSTSPSIIFNSFFGKTYLAQIMPTIGLGYYYFKDFFSPILSIISIAFALNFEKKAINSESIIEKNLFYLGVIMMTRTTAMSTVLSGVGYIFNLGITWIILMIFYQGKAQIKEYKEDKDE